MLCLVIIGMIIPLWVEMGEMEVVMDSDGQSSFFSQPLLWWWMTKGEKRRIKAWSRKQRGRRESLSSEWNVCLCQTGQTGPWDRSDRSVFYNSETVIISISLVCGLEYICVVCIMCVIDLFMLSKWYCASVTQIVWCIVFLAGCLGQTGLTGLWDRSDRSAPDRVTFLSFWWTELSCHMHHV